MQERNGKSGLVGTKESSIEAVPKVKLKRKMTRSVSCKRLHWPNESNLSERLTIRCAKDETIELEIVLDQARENRRTDDTDIEGVAIGMRSWMRMKLGDFVTCSLFLIIFIFGRLLSPVSRTSVLIFM